MQDFLPVTREDMKSRGWEAVDFVYVTGDAYVDHPSFGSAIIGRLLEQEREYPGVRGTAPGFSCYGGKHGFHGESLHSFQKTQKYRCLFPRGENGPETGPCFCCIQQSDPADI